MRCSYQRMWMVLPCGTKALTGRAKAARRGSIPAQDRDLDKAEQIQRAHPGDLDGLRARADAGEGDAAFQVASLLALTFITIMEFRGPQDADLRVCCREARHLRTSQRLDAAAGTDGGGAC